jgi:hypothetical protein
VGGLGGGLRFILDKIFNSSSNKRAEVFMNVIPYLLTYLLVLTAL